MLRCFLDCTELPSLLSSQILQQRILQKTFYLVGLDCMKKQNIELSRNWWLITVPCQVVYSSMLESRQERDLVMCLTERIFSAPNSILLDATTPSEYISVKNSNRWKSVTCHEGCSKQIFNSETVLYITTASKHFVVTWFVKVGTWTWIFEANMS